MSREVKLRYGIQVLLLFWGYFLAVGLLMYLILRGHLGSVHGMWIGMGMFSFALLIPHAIYYSLLEITVTAEGVSRRLKVLGFLGVGSHSIAWAAQPSISERPLPNDLWQIRVLDRGGVIKIESTMTGYDDAVDLLEEIGALPKE